MTRSSVVTPIPTVTGPSNVSGPNESAANGSFKPPRLVGRLGQETVDATEQSVACHWQCQCPLQHPVLLVNPGRPLAPECGAGGRNRSPRKLDPIRCRDSVHTRGYSPVQFAPVKRRHCSRGGNLGHWQPCSSWNIAPHAQGLTARKPRWH